MSKIKAEEEEKPPSSSDSEDSTNISPSPKSSSRPKNNPQNGKNLINNSGIKEVYKNNFKQEMKNLVSLLNKYNYIGMDTEFPGIVYQVDNYSDDFYYKSIKLNVESLKLIQLGITLSDEKGRLPSPYHTWQFNFEFDPEKDKSSKSSIDLLIKSGIDFNELKQNGIEHKSFFNVIKTSGLVLNPKIKWISFHGSYDFAYLLNNLISSPLPKTEKEFTTLLGFYFPNHYDIKILVKQKHNLKGSLNKLAHYLCVEREGHKHQAGSDSFVTIDVFWKLIKNKYIIKEELLEKKNILFGISKGKDNEEAINYIKIDKQDNEVNLKNINNYNIIMNKGKNMNNNNYYYENNNLYYMQANKNVYNIGMNYYYPQMKMKQINNGFNYFQIFNNNIVQYA